MKKLFRNGQRVAKTMVYVVNESMALHRLGWGANSTKYRNRIDWQLYEFKLMKRNTLCIYTNQHSHSINVFS